jgi:carboxyl-terminal processing protease
MGKSLTYSQVRNELGNPIRCRRLGYYYKQAIVQWNGKQVRLFFSKQGKNGKWKTFMSTNTSLSFIEMVKIYQLRWCIEVFFKESKQLFGLGKCQSTDFDAQIADTTMVMIRYMMASLKYRFDNYESKGAIFEQTKEKAVMYSLGERLWGLFLELVKIIEVLFDDIIHMLRSSYSRFLHHFSWSLIVFITLVSCQEDEVVKDDDNQISEETLLINNFIWENMDFAYLWNEYMPTNLNPNEEPDSKAYFEKLLYRPTDRWSLITDNAQELEESFQGISKTFGYKFQLYKFLENDNVYGIIQYVIPGLPAANAGLQRGDFFLEVDGTTLSTTNYIDLLFAQEQYTLTLGELNNGSLSPTDQDVGLTAIKEQENPILYHNIYDTEAGKVGYIVYNQFINSLEAELVDQFSEFENQGVEHLVLDLRYNPGGFSSTATVLSSMIAPKTNVDNEDVFYQQVFNDNLREFYLSQNNNNEEIFKTRFNPQSVNLTLDAVYILVTSSTASASELVINGLKPYMDVVLIGSENTSGKYTGSIMITDSEERHTWAIQPIIMKSANATGDSEYSNGFEPDFKLDFDDFSQPLGSPDEDFLETALSVINGAGPARISRTWGQLPLGAPVASGGARPIEADQRLIVTTPE